MPRPWWALVVVPVASETVETVRSGALSGLSARPEQRQHGAWLPPPRGTALQRKVRSDGTETWCDPTPYVGRTSKNLTDVSHRGGAFGIDV